MFAYSLIRIIFTCTSFLLLIYHLQSAAFLVTNQSQQRFGNVWGFIALLELQQHSDAAVSDLSEQVVPISLLFLPANNWKSMVCLDPFVDNTDCLVSKSCFCLSLPRDQMGHSVSDEMFGFLEAF